MFATSAFAQPAPHGSAATDLVRYSAVDLDAFAEVLGLHASPLYPGLRALVYGDAAVAERSLARAIPLVADTLHDGIYDRIIGSATRRFAWGDASHYARNRAEGTDSSFDPTALWWSFFVHRAAPSLSFRGDETIVPFDGYRVDGSIHGPATTADVRFFLDTGGSPTLMNRSLADRLGIAVDSVSRGRIAIPARQLEEDVYMGSIDSLRIGSLTLYNVPAQVVDTDRPVTDGSDLFLGFDILSGLLGGARYGFADSTLTLYAPGAVPAPPETAPNMLLEGYAFLDFDADGQPFTGVIDTGSPFSHVYADWWTPGEGVEGRPVTHSGRLADSEYSFTLDYYDLPATIAGQTTDLSLGLSRRGQVGAPFRVMSLLGTGLFADGALTLDFGRRIASYDR